MTAEGDEQKAAAIWTTWEELLLACAVKRHGLKDWDTVAMEIQIRTTPSLANSFTPRICLEKYHELKRRFRDETPAAAADDDGDVIEELRQLRVAELTKDVQRYDRSIQSLQLKVKRLEAEREHSLKESGEKNDARADLARSENDRIDADGVPAALLPANTAGKEVSGEHSNRSFNESNSSEDREKSAGERDSESEPVQTTTTNGVGGSLNPDPESKTVREDSCNDSSDTVAKHLAAKTSHARKKNSIESRDTEAASESKEGTKDSSDVQSSASLTKKKRRRPGEVSNGGDGGGSKVEPVEVSPATTTATTTTKREVVVKSDPSVAVMDIIRAHKHGSMFERRLESQKSDKYKKIVRQHVDLRIVQTRIDDGSYSFCPNKFFLDLLLIFNNAIVFFPKRSTESIAAQQLRLLVLKEMRKPERPKPEPAPLVAKPDPERSDSLLATAKHKSAVPIVVCRKRSSISGKPSSSKVEKEKEKPKDKEKEPAAKTLVIQKPPVKTSLNEDEDSMKIREKPVTGVRSMRRSGNNSSRSNSTSNVAPGKNHVTSSSLNLGNSTSKGSDGGGGGGPAKVVEKKKATEVTPVVKKRGAADFLKRLKKNSPAKETPAVEEDGGGKKDLVKKKVEESREGTVSRQKGGGGGGGGGGRQVKEDVSPSKRNVGRPPKKGKEVVVPAPARRRRETVEPESASKRPTKRSKR